MRDVLIVLNPRQIDECLSAIRALNIDKLWVRYLTESHIEACWTDIFTRIAGYDRAFIVSDDTVPHQPALDLVRGLLDDGHPVATGYCNLATTDFRVNLCPLPYPDTTVHLTFEQAQTCPSATIATSFAGFSLTGMSVDIWAKYPYRTVPQGWGADQTLSERLHADRVPIVAHRSAFVWHVKETWSQPDLEPRKRLLIGERPSSIDLEVCV